jgi:hypothetical protein
MKFALPALGLAIVATACGGVAGAFPCEDLKVRFGQEMADTVAATTQMAKAP